MKLSPSSSPPHNDGDGSKVNKRKRGRPPKPPPSSSPPSQGHSPADLQALASLGRSAIHRYLARGGLTAHVIIVNAEEDAVDKILEFARKVTPLSVCVFSANGSVSSAVLDKPGDPLRLEGHFEIFSLSGSVRFSGHGNDAQGNERAFKVLLAGPDGSLYAGVLTGPLIAAYPIQLVVAAFEQNITGEGNPGSHSAGPSAAARDLMETGKESCTSPTTGLVSTTDNMNSA